MISVLFLVKVSGSHKLLCMASSAGRVKAEWTWRVGHSELKRILPEQDEVWWHSIMYMLVPPVSFLFCEGTKKMFIWHLLPAQTQN